MSDCAAFEYVKHKASKHGRNMTTVKWHVMKY